MINSGHFSSSRCVSGPIWVEFVWMCGVVGWGGVNAVNRRVFGGRGWNWRVEWGVFHVRVRPRAFVGGVGRRTGVGRASHGRRTGHRAVARCSRESSRLELARSFARVLTRSLSPSDVQVAMQSPPGGMNMAYIQTAGCVVVVVAMFLSTPHG